MYTCSVFTMHNFNEFIEYVLSFYGDGGLYDQKRTKEQIAYATTVYLDTCPVDCIHWVKFEELDDLENSLDRDMFQTFGKPPRMNKH